MRFSRWREENDKMVSIGGPCPNCRRPRQRHLADDSFAENLTTAALDKLGGVHSDVGLQFVGVPGFGSTCKLVHLDGDVGANGGEGEIDVSDGQP